MRRLELTTLELFDLNRLAQKLTDILLGQFSDVADDEGVFDRFSDSCHTEIDIKADGAVCFYHKIVHLAGSCDLDLLWPCGPDASDLFFQGRTSVYLYELLMHLCNLCLGVASCAWHLVLLFQSRVHGLEHPLLIEESFLLGCQHLMLMRIVHGIFFTDAFDMQEEYLTDLQKHRLEPPSRVCVYHIQRKGTSAFFEA